MRRIQVVCAFLLAPLAGPFLIPGVHADLDGAELPLIAPRCPAGRFT